MSSNSVQTRVSRFALMSKKVRSVVAMAAAALLIAGVALVGGSVAPASADSEGAGNYSFGFFHGQYITSNGSIVYCLDSNAAEPIGVNSDYLGQTGSLDSLSSNQIAGLNWLVSTLGQTNDNLQAQNVAEAIWIVMGGFSTSRPVPHQYADAVNNYVYSAPSATGTVGLNLAVDPVNNFNGSVTISSLSHTPATGTLTLVNGKFLSTGTSSLAGTFSVGQSFNVVGVPPTQNGAPYKINVTANATAPIAGSYANRVGLWQASGGNYQRMISGGGTASGTATLTGFAEDPFTRSTQFAPIVTTAVVSKFVQEGDTFSDRLTFSTTTDEEGTNNPWTQNPANNNYAPVTATGVVYGPFDTPPVQSANIPAGAPIAGTASVTTSTLSGPTITYVATTTETAVGSGYYTWVWTIAQSAQIPTVQPFFLDDYVYTDQYGRAAETHISPQQVAAVTTVSEDLMGYTTSQGVTDSLNIDVLGNWTKDTNGDNIPVVLRGDVYFVAGDTVPTTSTTLPAGAVLLDSVTQSVTGEGIVVSQPVIPNTNFTNGYVFWVWKIVTADQPVQWQGYTVEWTDLFAVPSEMTRIEAPVVTTNALVQVAQTDVAYDVATVSGTMPTETTYLGFQAYLQPEGSTTPVCDATTLVFESANLIDVAPNTGDDYQSEDVTFDELGTYYWVETLYAPGTAPVVPGVPVARADAGAIISQGVCGAATETTTVSKAVVTTVATESGAIGSKHYDTATVTGFVPTGATLVFDVFLQAEGSTTPVCDVANRTATTEAAPVAVDAGENLAKVYKSPEVELTKVGTYFWAEKLLDRNGDIIHQGVCGASTEVTKIVPNLPNTGASYTPTFEYMGYGALVAALLGLGVVGIIIVRRRKAA